MKQVDNFLEFCFQFPRRNSKVTRTIPVNVEPSESLLGQVVLDQLNQSSRGTVLGPLLLLLYINDLGENCMYASFDVKIDVKI